MSINNIKREGFQQTSIGWIPSDWSINRLEKIADKIMVGIASAATHAYRDSGIILFRNQNIKEGYLDDTDVLFIDEAYEKIHKNKRLMAGDLLTARTGYPGVTCVVPEKYANTQSFTTLITRPNREIVYSEYLCYYINSDIGQAFFETNQIGGGQKNVNSGTLSQMPIPLPNKSEQKKIVDILGTWDEAINKIKQIISKLQQRKNGLIQQLLTGKRRLKEFDGEEVHFLEIHSFAKEVSLKNQSDKDLLVLSCTKYDGLVPSLEYFGRKIYSNDLTTYKIVPKNCFAYATNHIEEGSIGYQAKYDQALISPMYTVFKTNNSLDDEYLYKVLKSHLYIHEYKKRMEGSIDRRGGLRWDEFSKIKVLIPSIEEQKAIAEILNMTDDEINLQQKKLSELQKQKKGLMQHLLTGNVRVKLK